MDLKKLTDMVMKQAKEKGFGTKKEDVNVAEKMALIHSEVSEAYEAYRHKNIDGKDGYRRIGGCGSKGFAFGWYF